MGSARWGKERPCHGNSGLENGDLENSRSWNGPLEFAHWMIVADGRFCGLSAGDWTVLISGFGLSALAVLLL
jgi:hypothetical protein